MLGISSDIEYPNKHTIDDMNQHKNNANPTKIAAEAEDDKCKTFKNNDFYGHVGHRIFQLITAFHLYPYETYGCL